VARRTTPGGGAWALVVALLATNPLGWVIYVARALFGHERGAGLLAAPFLDGAERMMAAMSLHYPHVSMVSFADKFLTPTAFGLGDASLLGAGLALLFDDGADHGKGAALRSLALGAALVAPGSCCTRSRAWRSWLRSGRARSCSCSRPRRTSGVLFRSGLLRSGPGLPRRISRSSRGQRGERPRRDSRSTPTCCGRSPQPAS
jgi:hypothetical protein